MIRRGALFGGSLLLASLGCTKPAPPAPAVDVATTDPVAIAPSTSKSEPTPIAKKPDEAPPAPAKAEPMKPADEPAGTFTFPDDAAGRLLAKRLPPSLPAGPASGDRLTQRPRQLPDEIASPAPMAAAPIDMPARLPLPALPTVRLTPLPDQVPADLAPAELDLPERPMLATGPLTRQSGPDVARPVDLPILSNRPVPDRAPLVDPTLTFTAESVICAVLPLKTEVLGFLRINLPDPFENALFGKPITPVTDDPNRSLPDVPIQR